MTLHASNRKTSQLTIIAAPVPTTTGTSGKRRRTRIRNKPPSTTTHFNSVPSANRRMVTTPRASGGLNTRSASSAVPMATTAPPPNAPRADAAPPTRNNNATMIAAAVCANTTCVAKRRPAARELYTFGHLGRVFDPPKSLQSSCGILAAARAAWQPLDAVFRTGIAGFFQGLAANLPAECRVPASFPNAERREDRAKQILAGEGTRDFTQCLLHRAQILGHQLRAGTR